MPPHKSNDFTRDPCPYVIVYDVGIGFGLGALLGTCWNTFKGYQNSPKGAKMMGISAAIKSKAPIMAGGFAVWSGMFNAFDCTFSHMRHKEDQWNAIMAGAATGAVLSARAGPTAMLVSGFVGGVFLGAIEGAGVMFSKLSSNQYDPQPYPEPVAPHAPAQAEQPSSLFKGNFGFQTQQ